MITSTANERIKWVSKLQTKKKERDLQDVFVTEGMRMLKEVPKERLVSCFCTESFLRQYAWIEDTANRLEHGLEVVSDKVFDKITDTKTPQGVLAVVKREHFDLDDHINDKSLFVILENIQDPGNLGTIVRMSEAAGVDAVIMGSGTVDVYNPKTIRSSMGSIYRMPVIYSEDLLGTVDMLKKKSVNIFAATLDDSTEYYSCDYKKPTAFVIGNEGNGLTDEMVATASFNVNIPMSGEVESLNAAVATSILCFEASRQRRM